LDNSIIGSLVDFKKNGVIERIGVSVYAPDELCFITENLKSIVDVVQIPFNVFDCARWLEPIRVACSDGLEIFCRSVFLQGAIFKQPDDEFVVSYNAGKQLLFIHGLCEKYNCDIGSFAFSFCSSFREISGLLFGLETLAQLNDNLLMIKNLIKISDSDIALVLDAMKDVDADFVDPRTWVSRV
jgi:aryl-alcohol dehydrogenase-like predicted oxidoreductase